MKFINHFRTDFLIPCSANFKGTTKYRNLDHIPLCEQFLLEETNEIYYSLNIYSNVRSYQLNGRVLCRFFFKRFFYIQNDKSSIAWFGY